MCLKNPRLTADLNRTFFQSQTSKWPQAFDRNPAERGRRAVLANRRGVDAGRDRVHHVGRRLLDNSSTGRITLFELLRSSRMAFRAAPCECYTLHSNAVRGDKKSKKNLRVLRRAAGTASARLHYGAVRLRASNPPILSRVTARLPSSSHRSRRSLQGLSFHGTLRCESQLLLLHAAFRRPSEGVAALVACWSARGACAYPMATRCSVLSGTGK